MFDVLIDSILVHKNFNNLKVKIKYIIDTYDKISIYILLTITMLKKIIFIYVNLHIVRSFIVC